MFSPLVVPVRWLSRLQSRGVARLALLATMAVGASLTAVGRRALNQPTGPMPPPGARVALAGRDTDTVRVYGPKKFDTPNGKAAHHVEQLTLPVESGQHYLLRVENGAPDGAGRVATVELRVNGTIVLTEQDLPAGGGAVTLDVQAAATTTLDATVSGDAGAFVTVTVLATVDPTTTIYGPQRFNVGTVTTSFPVAASASAPFSLVLANGEPNGTGRAKAVTIWLNAVEVVKGKDVTTTVATVTKSVTLKATNTLKVKVDGVTGAHIYLRFTATGTTAPVLTITAPVPNLITSQTSLAVTGSVQDQTAVQVTVNGTPATVSGTSFAGTAQLTVEGTNTIHVVATNAAGLTTDSSRTVRRDTQAPTLTVTAPVSPFVTNLASVTVSGTVSDATPVTVNVNGIPLPVGTGGAFTGSVALTEGTNTLTITATDAAGNQTVVVRTVIRDTQAPVLTVTAPANLFITKLTSVTVSGTVTDATPVTLSVNGAPLTVGTGGAFTGTVALVEGANTLTFTATDGGGRQTVVTRTGRRDTQAPILTVTAPADHFITKLASVTVSGTVMDATAVTVDANGVPLPVDGAGVFTGSVSLAEGANSLTIRATDQAGNSATAVRIVTRDNQAPALTVTAPADGAVVTEDVAAVQGTATDLTAVTLTVNGSAVTVGTDGSFSTSAAVGAGTTTITIVATDAAQNATTLTRSVTRQGNNLPPDPVTVATPIDATVVTTVAASTAFLYTGANPIQTGVVAGTIEPVRAAVLRGKVLDRDGNPLPGVTVTILGHLELGQTLSRADGMYDMAVNGGGLLTVSFVKSGYLLTQRPAEAPWQDYAVVDDVIMLQADPQVTAIDFTQPMAVARGTPQTDQDGTRQATVLFPQGTQASMVLPDGSTQPLSALHVRATEYTVGPRGPQAMPGPLPPASAYTYAVELSADEAGAARVEFSQPVILYLENFLRFRVGMAVPLGFYDRDRAAWVPAPDGRVIQVLATSGGMAALDTDGDGIADDPAVLAALGITDAERARLAELYQPGQSLWRAPISHFSPWDCNNAANTDGAKYPTPKAPRNGKGKDKPCNKTGGSVIECENQVLGERIGVAETPFTLNYRSSRVPGHGVANRLVIPLIGDTVPPALLWIALQIHVAGRMFEDSFPAAPNQQAVFDWDGKDAYGRVVQGLQPVSMFIGYRYRSAYREPAAGGRSFGLPGAEPVTGVSTRVGNTLALWQRTMLGAWHARAAGLGGWTLTVHHAYDAVDRTLYLGDGTQRSTASIGQTITTVAGNGRNGARGDGVPATEAELSFPVRVTAAPDGGFYIADVGNQRVRRVNSLGIITTVAGTGTSGFDGDGGPAVNAELSYPVDVALGRDGSIYIADALNNSIRRVGPEGTITTFAGNGYGGWSGDGGPATAAQIDVPEAVAMGPDGSLYIAEGRRVRRVGPDGIITTVAGDSMPEDSVQGSSDGGLATAARLSQPYALAVAPDGTIYIGDTWANRVRRIGPDGIITAFAGTGEVGFSGDGGPATAAQISLPLALAIGSDRSLYIADALNGRIRRVGPDGIITTVAGTGDLGGAFGGDGGPPVAAAVGPTGVSLGANGTLYIADEGNQRIRAISPVLPGLGPGDMKVASADGSEVYVFDPAGRHLRTVDALTGAVRYRFEYDAAGRLAGVVDRDGLTTSIARLSDGTPTSITSPDGIATTLALDPNGYLASVTNPAGETTQLTSTVDGLLLTRTDPTLSSSRFTYDSLGQLIEDADAAGGTTSLARTTTDSGSTVSQTTSLGRTTRYGGVDRANGEAVRRVTLPSGLEVVSTTGSDGSSMVTYPDGSVVTSRQGPDPRFGMQAPFVQSRTVQLPSGLRSTMTAVRTASLANPADPLSLVTQTDTVRMNGYGVAAVTSYTAATRQLVQTSTAGREVAVTQDTNGWIVSARVADLDSVTFNYDARGRLTRQQQGGRITSYGYHASSGRLANVTDPLGRVTQFEYDSAGRVTTQTLPDGRAIGYTYDANGNLTSLTPPGRPAYGFQYTPVNLTQRYDPPGIPGPTPTRYFYNRDRQLDSLVRPDSVSIAFGYDAAGRSSSVRFDRGTLTYGYSGTTGNLVGIRAPTGDSLAFSYDGPLRTAVRWKGIVNGSVEVGYISEFSGFQVGSQTVNGADQVDFTYDFDGLLMSAGALTLNRNVTNGLLETDALGSIASEYRYTSRRELASAHVAGNGTDLFGTGYQRDSLGRIVQLDDTTQGTPTHWRFVYDSIGRLVADSVNGAPFHVFSYDANGNRLSYTSSNGIVSYSYDAQDRLLSAGTTGYTHGSNGELRTKTVSGVGTTTYSYDAFGNLITVALPNGTQIDYVIDGQNRRIGRKVNGVLVQGWLYQSQLNAVAELDGAGNVVSRFVYGGSANVPDYMERNGLTYRVVSDHLGSVRLVVDAATDAVVQRIDYDEWGNVTQNTNQGFQSFGFAGGLTDEATGLVRVGARDYDPEIGRWTAKDPIAFAGGSTNPYEYAGSDPVNYTDPTGLCPCEAGPGEGSRRIEDLDPSIQGAASELIRRAAEMGITLKMSSTYRTDEQQDELYEHGRNGDKRRIVTPAKGGDSQHNYGTGFDVIEVIDGKWRWDFPHENEIGALGESLGLDWGGHWKDSHDGFHFGSKVSNSDMKKAGPCPTSK